MARSTTTALPEDFVARLTEVFGLPFAQAVVASAVEKPTTFRANTLTSSAATVREQLGDLGFKMQGVSWYSDAFILKNKSKRELMETALYTEGKIYLQSLASMLPPLVLEPQAGEKVLDLTAAPGSKTSQIAALMKAEGQLIANDNNKIRFFKLMHNMENLGVTAERAAWDFSLTMLHGVALVKKYKNYFDKILLDAPCSAEARFITSDPSTFGYWSERKVREMAYKQRQLLLSAWGALKPGGTLVYSTCTFSPEENELQIARLLERFKDAALAPIALDGVKRGPVLVQLAGKKFPSTLQHALRAHPTKEIEGFFVAKFIKQTNV